MGGGVDVSAVACVLVYDMRNATKKAEDYKNLTVPVPEGEKVKSTKSRAHRTYEQSLTLHKQPN